MAEQTFRTANVFDGTESDGRPHVDRQMLDEREARQVLAYLESAPTVHSVEGFGPDRIDPTRGKSVPLTWHTDGEWVWPGSVTHYLRRYALPPEADFLAHIRMRGYRLADIDPIAMRAAMAAVSGAAATNGDVTAGQPHPHQPPPEPANHLSNHTASPELPAYQPSSVVTAAPPPAPSDPGPSFDRLRAAALELGIPAGAYRIGAPSEGAWSLLREPAGWAVFRSEQGTRHDLVTFANAQQAAAYLIGQLYLAREPHLQLAGLPEAAGIAASAAAQATRQPIATSSVAEPPPAEPPTKEPGAAELSSPDRPGTAPAAESVTADPQTAEPPTTRPAGALRPAAAAAASTGPSPTDRPAADNVVVDQPLEPSANAAEAASTPATPLVAPPVGAQPPSIQPRPTPPAAPEPSPHMPAAVERATPAEASATPKPDSPPAVTPEADVEKPTPAPASGSPERPASGADRDRPKPTLAARLAAIVAPPAGPTPPKPDGGSRADPVRTATAGTAATDAPPAGELDAGNKPSASQTYATNEPQAERPPTAAAPSKAADLSAPAEEASAVAKALSTEGPQAATRGQIDPTRNADHTGFASSGSPVAGSAAAGSSIAESAATGSPVAGSATSGSAATASPAAGSPAPGSAAGQPAATRPPAVSPSTGSSPSGSSPSGSSAAGSAAAGSGAESPAGARTPAVADQPAGTGREAQPSAPVGLFDTPQTDVAARTVGRDTAPAAPSDTPSPAAASQEEAPSVQPSDAAKSTEAPSVDQPAGKPSPATVKSGAQGTFQQSTPQWKIQPLPGDPPLTLYRDKRMVMLSPGTEVDRYGEPTGNVTYAARTLYQHRSLPADWIGYPYHVYRLQRPLEALTGLAVPWFEQPGGGTAFVLPKSIAELIADGSLVEVEASVGPPSR